MNLELSDGERDLLQRVVEIYLSDLRQTIAATQRGTSGLHAEEDMIKGLLAKISR
jgi:hypothetical protein